MANTFIPLGKTTLTNSSTTTVTFSSISQAYTDLNILISARSTNTGSLSDNIVISFNGVSTNQSSVQMYSNGSGTPAGYVDSVARAYYITAANSTNANSFGISEIYIPQYSSTTSRKNYYTAGGSEDNLTAMAISFGGGLWNTTSAITQIDLTTSSGQPFANGSNFYLYGISKN